MKSFRELLNPETSLTPEEAIEQMKAALNIGDNMMMLELICPDNENLMPDWEIVPDHVYEEWETLVDLANDKIN